MYILLGISLMFALLLALNVLVSAAATVLWRVLAPATESWSAQTRAQTIFALRVFPFAAALVFVLFILLPAYLLFEPRASGETVSHKLAGIAIFSAVGVAFAFYRVFGTWWKTRRLVSDWIKNAEPIEIKGVEIPVYRLTHPFPVIAVVGAFQPKMFVASRIFAALDEEEFQAAVLHEFGHLAARDNFKRIVMRVCRDLLVIPFGRSLDRAWAKTTESAADEYAARNGGNSAAVNLAAALVKIARIVPRGAAPTMPAGAFLLTGRNDFLSSRVRRLLQLTEIKFAPGARAIFGLSISFWTILFPVLSVFFLLAVNQDFLRQTHNILEGVVEILQ